MYIGLHVKCPLLLSDFNGIEFSQFYENVMKIFALRRGGGRRVFPCVRTDSHDETNNRF